MAIQLLRGHVKDVSSPDNHGAADCHIGKYNVKVSGDLVSSVGQGTNNILLMGASAFICMLGFVLALKAINSGGAVQSADMVMAFIGMVGMGITLRRLFLINRAANWVSRVEL